MRDSVETAFDSCCTRKKYDSSSTVTENAIIAMIQALRNIYTENVTVDCSML